MPANLPPQYFEVEKRYREARSVSEKLKYLEEMLAIMPKHKGTDKLKADLRRRIAQLKDMGAARKGPGRRAPVYLVDREGVGQVALLGPPNTGKSSLLAALTKAQPAIADYPYTTRIPLAGMMRYENVQVQLVDCPPLGEEYLEPWFPDLLRRAEAFAVVLAPPEDPAAHLEALKATLAGFHLALSDPDYTPPAPRLEVRRTLVIFNKADLLPCRSGWCPRSPARVSPNFGRRCLNFCSWCGFIPGPRAKPPTSNPLLWCRPGPPSRSWRTASIMI